MRPHSESLKYIIISLIILYFITPSASAYVLISEFMPNPIDSCLDCTEWVELSSDTGIANLTLDAGGKNTTFSFNITGFFIITENKTLFLESWSVDESTVIEGAMSLNNNGDCIVLYNATTIKDQVCYSSQHENFTWSLCNGSWTETENATPGSENSCPEESDPIHMNDTGGNATDVFDYSGISLEVSGPATPVRFGDFSQVKAVIHTGGNKVPLRIVAYIYSPHWISVDLEGEIIHYQQNETETSLVIETSEGGEDMIINLPIFIKNNCDGDYSECAYTGKVKIYEDGTDVVVDDDNFNITLNGNNPLLCPAECDCPKCKETKCSCSSSSGTSTTNGNEPEMIELISFTEEVEAGVPFETKVRIENVENLEHAFSVYSYAYDGSRCISMGFDGTDWKKTWTANKHSFELMPGKSTEIILKNAFGNETNPGIYTFRIRLKYLERKVDITKVMKVTPASEAEKNEEVFNDIEIITDENEDGNVPVTGMAATWKEPTNMFQDVYETFVSWLSSVFKF